MLPSVASGLSPSTLGGKPVLELACISQDQPTKLSEHSGGLVMSLLTSNSPTDLDHHSPALLNNHRRSFSSDFADKTTPEALVHPSIPCTDLRVTRSPEPVADRPPDTKPSVNPSAHDLAQALFPTPSTSSGHDSSHPSPVAIEASYGFPTSTTDCDLADSSDVRPTLGRRKKSKVQSKAAKTLDVQLINDLPAATAEVSLAQRPILSSHISYTVTTFLIDGLTLTCFPSPTWYRPVRRSKLWNKTGTKPKLWVRQKCRRVPWCANALGHLVCVPYRPLGTMSAKPVKCSRRFSPISRRRCASCL